ncbi:tryptophan 2,3-dioxygenase family protein [Streptomyces sp. NBC_01384]|uniref:tryptophan 2,3-dioxygenase family protein n=1 Tax=Streptomyces sp. NBC_01384 TaxID=2903847 RepID=UPI003252726F
MIPTTAPLTYGAYLRLPYLLDQQVPLTGSAHDEHLFIAVHQVHELWFKLLLVECADARDRMLAGETAVPGTRLRRCELIVGTLCDAVRLLDTMEPRDFLAFRDGLGTASGAQSAQYHEIGILLGGPKDRARIGRMGWLTPDERSRVRRRLAEPSLWDGFLALLAAAGFAHGTRAERFAAYAEIARDPAHKALGELMESLLDHDRAWSRWRSRHVLVVERQLGGAPGTAGSAGATYLRARADERFFPELWGFRGTPR